MAEHVYTVGHSTHAKEKLIELLSGHRVTAVADVRSRPYSRFNPQLNKETLCANLKAAGVSYVIALLCAEKDPLTCHRTILVCRHLAARGIGAQHILDDGRLESHDDALTRLLVELGIKHELFRSRDELIVEAYTRRGQQIAYSKKAPPEEGARGAAR